jgi:UDP-glucose 4-epimerase
MARCLVTGHKGYIGSRLYKRLEELGHKVQGIDLLDEEWRGQAGYGKDIITMLAEGNDGLFHPHWFNFKPEYVFHMACWPRVGYSVENPVKTARNNILAGSVTLNFARKVGAKRVIYSSSSSVVGNGNGPASPYALQKYTTELECRMYPELYGMDTVSLRYFNVYSHDQQASGPYATAVCNWMKAVRGNVNPFITGDGEQRRDMINVEDVVAANIFAMEHEESFNGQHFDVGTGQNISLNEIKELVLKCHPGVIFDYVAPRPGDVLLTRGATEPLKKLGWTASIGIEEGIEDCFRRLVNE